MTPRRALGWVAAALLGAAMLAPFAVMLSTSLMDEFEVFRQPAPLLPASPQWRNYPAALTALPFARFFLNTFVFPAIWSRETEERMIEEELRKRQDQP